jgi:hypothetical protein
VTRLGISSMRERRAIRYLVVPIALLALLLVVTLGGMWHHHAGSFDANCPICHLSHQPIERPLAAHRAPTLALLEHTPEAQETGPAPTVVFRRLPARAPPPA